MKDFDLATRCPWCNRENDAVRNADGDSMPGDGDVSLCVGCACIGVFEVTSFGLRLRRPTDAEMREIGTDPATVRMQQRILNGSWAR